MEQNLVWMFLGVSCIEMTLGFLIQRKLLQPLLKIQHRGQTVVFRIFKCISKTIRFCQILSIAEMIFIIMPSKDFRDQSCQATPCKSYCPWKVKNDILFLQFSVNTCCSLKTVTDRKKLSFAEMILMISATKVFLSQNCWITSC